MTDPPADVVLALVADLIFSSKITTTARAAGVAVKVLRDPAKLAGEPGGRLLVDLNVPGAIAAARQWISATGGQAIGFVSHVDTPTIEAARQAGITEVLPRGRFVQQLPELLR